jgi:hypothetical protein
VEATIPEIIIIVSVVLISVLLGYAMGAGSSKREKEK